MTNGSSSDRRSGEDRRIRQERFQGPDRRSGGDRRGPGYVNGLRRSEAVTVARSLAAPAQDSPAFPPTLREMLDRIGDVLTDLVGRFYEASMDARLWPETLAKLRDVMHADTCAIVSHDFGTGSGRLEHSVNIDSMYVSAYTDYYAAHNPWLQNRGALGSAGSVWTSQQLANDGDVGESDFYRFWLRPQNVMHHLFGVIQADKDRMLLIVFARSPERGAFWQDDSDLLRRLLPVLNRGLAAGRAHEHSRGIQRLALDTLDAMPIGVIMLNTGGGGARRQPLRPRTHRQRGGPGGQRRQPDRRDRRQAHPLPRFPGGAVGGSLRRSAGRSADLVHPACRADAAADGADRAGS